MRLLIAGLLVVAGFYGAAGGAVRAAEPDPDCLQKMDTMAIYETKRFHVYQDALKGMKDNTQASRAASICGGALSRANAYYKRQVADKSVCVVGSSYVDQQVPALFKNATNTCSGEFQRFAKQLPLEEQQRIIQEVSQKEGAIRPDVK